MARLVPSIAIACLLAHVGAADALAQGRKSPFSIELSTLNRVHLQVGPLEEQAQRCGLVASDLESPLKSAIKESKLVVRDSAPDSLFVNASVIALNDMCMAALDLEVYRWSTEFRATVSVWAHKAVLASDQASFSGHIRDRVTAITKEFLEVWAKAKQ